MVEPLGDGDREALARHIQGVAREDRDDLEEVYRRTSAKLFGICLRILPNRADAEEALQETYLAVWRNARSFDPARGSAVTWLATIARNRAGDQLRATYGDRSVSVELADQVPDPRPDPESTLQASEEERLLVACLQQLEPRDAGYIRTAFLEGRTYAELAAGAGTPLATLKSRIRRALIKLRECLG